MSSIEAEYSFVLEATKTAYLTKKFIEELGAVPSIENPVKVRHYIREAISLQNVEVIKVHTHDNTVDPLMKALPCDKYVFPDNGMGLCYIDSSEDSNETPSKEDLDNLFGPLYEEYYKTRSPEVSTNFAANTLNNEDTPSSSSIIDEENEAPQIVSSSEEPIANEPTTLVSDDNADESVQENTAELDKNTFINPFYTPILEEAGSSLTNQDPSNMHEFY
ncbi:hypothetical protein Tco_0480245 [Tanacetum coccineum]